LELHNSNKLLVIMFTLEIVLVTLLKLSILLTKPTGIF